MLNVIDLELKLMRGFSGNGLLLWSVDMLQMAPTLPEIQ